MLSCVHTHGSHSLTSSMDYVRTDRVPFPYRFGTMSTNFEQRGFVPSCSDEHEFRETRLLPQRRIIFDITHYEYFTGPLRFRIYKNNFYGEDIEPAKPVFSQQKGKAGVRLERPQVIERRLLVSGLTSDDSPSNLTRQIIYMIAAIGALSLL